MVAKRKPQTMAENDVTSVDKEENKNVNLLQVYRLYKPKFRKLTKEDYNKLLGPGKEGKVAAVKLCKEFMSAKNIPEDVSFEKNVGFLSLPRFMPMVALLAERADYKIRPDLVSKLTVSEAPERFAQKFSCLLVYGFWFLGRVIRDSLSPKEQVNRGNTFKFVKGDLGYWWAGVRILDWNAYVRKEAGKHLHNCAHFITIDMPYHRAYTDRAIHNMGQHPLYFLSEEDWDNFHETVKLIRHKKVRSIICCPALPIIFFPPLPICSCDDMDTDSEISSHYSVDLYGSKESID